MRYYLLPLLLFFSSCANLDLTKVQDILVNGERPLTRLEMGQGLKDTLSQGIVDAVIKTSKVDGYLKNSAIRIPFPSEAEKVKSTIEKFGGKSLINKFETSLNRSAEKAASLAKPIFLKAITELTFTDALNIIKGEKNAATDYLKSKTYDQLFALFRPQVASSLNSVDATKYWGEIIGRYNKIPFIKKVNPDLQSYATEKALNGLFYEVSKQEALIRENPAKRTTDLMKKIFNL